MKQSKITSLKTVDKNNKVELSLFERGLQSFGISLAVLAGIVLIYILLLAIFIKGTLSGWF